MDIDKLKSRITKLLALSRCNGATESEAENAMEHAMKLMVEHHLTEKDVQTIPEKVTKQKFEEKTRELWPAMIWAATAKLYMCHHYYNSRVGVPSLHIIVGTPDNILLASNMALHFVELCRNDALTQAGKGRLFISAYKKGFASRLSQRLYARLAEAKAPQPSNNQAPGTSLSLALQYKKAEEEIKDYVAQNIGKVATRSAARPTSSDGFHYGQQSAENVALGGALDKSTKAGLKA